MTNPEKKIIKQIKEELVVMRLQTRVLTEDGFKKQIGKIIKLIEGLGAETV